MCVSGFLLLKMGTVMCVRGFLLLSLISGFHPSPRLLFHSAGGNVSFHSISPFSRVDDYVLYKVSEEGDVLLANCSQPDRPAPGGYDVKCVKFISNFRFVLSNLTLSHSGEYRDEAWRRGIIKHHGSFRLTVCAEKEQKVISSDGNGEHVVLCHLPFTLGNSSVLQMYSGKSCSYSDLSLVLDTKTSLDSAMKKLKGRVQVDLKNSLVTLEKSGQSNSRQFCIYCFIWNEAQCQSYSENHVIVPPGPRYIVAYEEENMTLPCFPDEERPNKVHWTINIGHAQITVNLTHPQEVMYMLNGTETGDYSLTVQAFSRPLSGIYSCKVNDLRIGTFHIHVCAKGFPSDVMFSHGQTILLNITEHLNKSWFSHRLQWYCQKFHQPRVLITGERMETGRPGPILTISNLTEEDSGVVYTWTVYGYVRGEFWRDQKFCFEGAFHLVYRDPFGVHSAFYRTYAPLMGAGLLGLATAVIWVKLRSRRGEKSREGQQSGDEDFCEEVEMAELNMPPLAV